MTEPYRYDPLLTDTLIRAAESYRRRDDDGTAQALEEAIRRAPWRSDLRLCLAGRHIQHGAPELAVSVYEDLLRRIPGDLDTLFFLAHWQRFLGNSDEAERRVREMAAARPDKAAVLERIWAIIDRWEAHRVGVDVSADFGQDAALLLLGYVLNNDGSPRPALVKRLEKGLELAERFPRAVIVVSGGVPRGGRVEAVVMREWLEEKGIDPARIFEEGYSRDTVENLLFCRQVVAGLGVRQVAAVTCAHNIRRVGAGLDAVALGSGFAWRAEAAAAEGPTFTDFRDDGADRIKVYRDTLRAFGIPMMTTYPYLAER